MELSRRSTILTCENCGTELPEGASFCARCGTPVSVARIGPVHVPQAAPQAEEVPSRQGSALPQLRPTYAGFWLRAVAYLIDTIIVSITLALAGSFDSSAFIRFPD